MSVGTAPGRWKIGRAWEAALSFHRRVVIGPISPLETLNDTPNGYSMEESGIAWGLWTSCASIKLRITSAVCCERADKAGTETARLNLPVVASNTACGCIEAGNEADGENNVKGRRRDDAVVVFDRRRDFEGGVGGVAIQVGVEGGNKTRGHWSLAGVVSLVVVPKKSLGCCEDELDVGVQMGDAVMTGRGKKPHILSFVGDRGIFVGFCVRDIKDDGSASSWVGSYVDRRSWKNGGGRRLVARSSGGKD